MSLALFDLLLYNHEIAFFWGGGTLHDSQCIIILIFTVQSLDPPLSETTCCSS